MECLSVSSFTSTGYTVLYVVAGNGRIGGENDGFLVILRGNISAVSVTAGAIIQFGPDPNSNFLQEYPILGNQDPTSLGMGNMGIYQNTDEIGSHQHGGTPSDPGGLRIEGAPLANRGANSGFNNGAFSFTRPAYTIGAITYPAVGLASVPKTMNTLPYNLGVTMCIKF
jgi:hypothetical protein